MTTDSTPPTPTVDTPIVCTMPAEEVPEQLLGWSDLQRRALNVVAIDSGVSITLPTKLADQVRDLVHREASCCAFLNFDITLGDDTITLEVTAPNPDSLPVISALAGIPLP